MQRTNQKEKTHQKRLPDAVCGAPTVEFTQVSNEMLRSQNLTMKAKGLLSILLSNKNRKWTSFIAGLQNVTCEGVDAIRSGLKELEEAEYLIRIHYVDKKTKRRRGSFWVYSHFPGEFNIDSHLEFLEQNGLEIQAGQNIPENLVGKDYNKKQKKKSSENKKNPDVENPDVDNPSMENPTLKILNNNNINNNNKNKKNTKRVSLEDFYSFFPEEWIESKTFQNTIKDFYYHRKEIGKKLTQTSAKRLSNKLSKYKQRVAAEAVERSIENGWQGVFPDNNTQSHKKPKTSIEAPTGKQYPKGKKHQH